MLLPPYFPHRVELPLQYLYFLGIEHELLFFHGRLSLFGETLHELHIIVAHYSLLVVVLHYGQALNHLSVSIALVVPVSFDFAVTEP